MQPPRHQYHVYFMSNKKDGVLYIGVTSFLEQRIHQHKTGHYKGFSKKYNLHALVYSEEFKYVNDAIKREKQLKNWRREWKIELVEKDNPEWLDLATDWVWEA